MKKVILKIEGMTCSACSNGLEKHLKKQVGIIDVSVNLVLALATITYQNIKVKDIENYIKSAGFKSLGEFKTFELVNNKKSSKVLIVMGILLVITMYLSMAHMFEFPSFNLLSQNKDYILLIISLIFLYYGKDILISGVKNLFNKMPNMDTLILLSVGSSFLYSIHNLFISSISNLYFESICMVIYFVKLGRFIENNSKDKTRDAIKELVSITPETAVLKSVLAEKEVTIDEICQNDVIICRSGERIAVDGEVVFGRTYVDESFITGESKPVLKEIGSKVITGSICYDGVIEYKALKVGRDSTISEIVRLVIEATGTKNKFQRLADKISGYFVYIVIILAIITFLIQFITTDLNNAINHFVTILVIACPCSVGLAVPMVVVNSTGMLLKRGLFIRNSTVLEKGNKIDTIIFDKTGTLTYGKLKISKVFNYSNYKEKDLLNIVSNIENKSLHPIKTAFSVKEILPVENFKNHTGLGISATINNKEYYLGNKKILEKLKIKDNNIEDYQELIKQGNTIIYVIENKKIIGLIGVRDIVRKEAKEVIEKLNQNNFEVIMLTGDNEVISKIIAKELNIKNVVANVVLKEKAKFVSEIVKSGKKVIMVGDGINDAPALLNSTIAISFESGILVANYSSDIILKNNNLNNILDFLKISKKAYNLILENLVFAFFYNTVMLVIATGLIKEFNLNPMLASLFMTISSLTVVFNSLRVGRIKNENRIKNRRN